jgi:FkbM family methyltransferase
MIDLSPAIFPDTAEEALKEEFFRGSPSGFFVDVGANAPQRWSQTWAMEQRGWAGVLIEPQPDLAAELRQQRRARVYAVACSSPANSGKTMRLHLAGIFTSLNPDFYVSGMHRHGSIDVPIMTLDEILADAQAPTPIDFISIDVESHEVEVLSGFDLARWRPRLIMIEDLAKNLRVHRYLQEHGYKWFRRSGLNAWYVPDDHPLSVGLFGTLQFFRKYYLGVPFRIVRDAKRKLLRQ